MRFLVATVCTLAGCFPASVLYAQGAPVALETWLRPQTWRRDTDGPILSLGAAGKFDDTHIFAPAVIRDGGRFLLWYCGSQGAVNERVFQLGLADSNDGKVFQRHASNPVLRFSDGRKSVLTPTLLREAHGQAVKENGRLRMWFSSTDFRDPSGLHTLHETSSADGVAWTAPSPSLLKHVYAPSVIRDSNAYRMWFVDVESSPWIIRHATSRNGRSWRVDPKPCLVVDQAWENSRLFYPTVIKSDGVYMMWYGSYWKARAGATATGFAVSADGLTWRKHPGNPVLRPDSSRSWESNYVTSQSVIRLQNGSFRIWYASRKKPPFKNKYFALNTAIWQPRDDR